MKNYAFPITPLITPLPITPLLPNAPQKIFASTVKCAVSCLKSYLYNTLQQYEAEEPTE